jgi:hypothetical protein
MIHELNLSCDFIIIKCRNHRVHGEEIQHRGHREKCDLAFELLQSVIEAT